VVPAIRGLLGGAPATLTVTGVAAGDLADEVRAVVRRDGPHPLPASPPPPSARAWLQRFRAHEGALLVALRHPSRQRVLDALDLDPTIIGSNSEPIANALWEDLVPLHANSVLQ
jgi:alpha-galactosidase/6-phospho-beta-glucosidase family protein